MLNLLGSVAVKTAPDEKILVAAQRAGNRLLWLPSKALASLKGTIKNADGNPRDIKEK